MSLIDSTVKKNYYHRETEDKEKLGEREEGIEKRKEKMRKLTFSN